MDYSNVTIPMSDDFLSKIKTICNANQQQNSMPINRVFAQVPERSFDSNNSMVARSSESSTRFQLIENPSFENPSFSTDIQRLEKDAQDAKNEAKMANERAQKAMEQAKEAQETVAKLSEKLEQLSMQLTGQSGQPTPSTSVQGVDLSAAVLGQFHANCQKAQQRVQKHPAPNTNLPVSHITAKAVIGVNNAVAVLGATQNDKNPGAAGAANGLTPDADGLAGAVGGVVVSEERARLSNTSDPKKSKIAVAPTIAVAPKIAVAPIRVNDHIHYKPNMHTACSVEELKKLCQEHQVTFDKATNNRQKMALALRLQFMKELEDPATRDQYKRPV